MAQRGAGIDVAGATGRARKDTASTRQLMELIGGSVQFSQGWVVSALPRGSIRLLQPSRLPETLLKAYERTGHAHDRPAWGAITRGVPTRSTNCWTATEYTTSIYYRDIFKPHGLLYSLAIPLSAPILAGYPGAVLLMRRPEEGDFTDAELTMARDLGRELDEYLVANRPVRSMDLAVMADPWTRAVPTRHIIFGRDARPVFPKKLAGIPDFVTQQLAEHVRKALETARRGHASARRLLLPDERGELLTFNIEGFKEFPALGDGSFVLLCLQPEVHQWGVIKAWEVAADDELARMLPAMKFMESEFAKSPSLDDIAQKAHLSPFHFHRRFTDLVGQTPKHFLVSCQMHTAKRMLVARRRLLPQLAADCGFSHQSHFTSRFRQTVGLTPTRWRRLAAELVMHGARH